MAVGRHSSGLLDNTEWALLNAGLPKYYSHIVALFEKFKAPSYVIDFARLGLQFAIPNSAAQDVALRSDLLSRLFTAAIHTSRYDLAHSFLSTFTDSALQHANLSTLVTQMCESSCASQLLDLPFLGLQDAVDAILATKCASLVDVNVATPYHKILYAWRIRRNDFRGAAAVSLEHLQHLQQRGDGDRVIGDDEGETDVTKQYLTLINALSCVDPKQAWILSEGLVPGEQGARTGKRSVVTLDDVRRGYQEELDRIAAVENNQFAFADGDEMVVI